MPDKPDKGDRGYLTVSELAERWNVTERTIQRWITDGDFPNAYRIGLGRGSHFRVPVADILAFEEARKQIFRS